MLDFNKNYVDEICTTGPNRYPFSNPSQASMTPVERAWASQKRLDSMNQMQMKNVRVLAAKKTQRKLIVANDLSDDENDDLPGPDELDLQTPYRRPTVVNTPQDTDEPLSDYVTVRLAIARARAMDKYRQTHL